MRFEDRETQSETAALGRDEVVEDRGEAIRRDARTRVGDRDLDRVADARGGDGHRTARRRRLNGVRDQVAIHAAEREAIALDDERAFRVVSATP